MSVKVAVLAVVIGALPASPGSSNAKAHVARVWNGQVAATRADGPDCIDDALFNRVLRLALKGDEPMPRPQARGPGHLLQISR